VPLRDAGNANPLDDRRQFRVEFAHGCPSHPATENVRNVLVAGVTRWGMDEFDASRSAARMRDAESSLTGLRERFSTPEGTVYMDGNSLGVHGEDAAVALERAVDQWRELGIEAWTEADPPWFDYGERLGDRLADVVGAKPSECVAANSTTVNIHALVGTFLDAADGTRVVVNELDFPTDHYAIRAQLEARGLDPVENLVAVESDDGRTIETDAIEAAVDDDTAIVFMPSVLYRSGQLFDLEAVTDVAHEHDAFAGFDLAHSVGVVPTTSTSTAWTSRCGVATSISTRDRAPSRVSTFTRTTSTSTLRSPAGGVTSRRRSSTCARSSRPPRTRARGR